MIGCKRYEQHYEQRSRRCHKMATLVKYSVLTPGAGRCHRPGRLYADTAYMAWRIGESDENGEFVGRAGGCRCAGGRSEERRVGKEGVSTCRFRGWPAN